MAHGHPSAEDQAFFNRALEATVRIGLAFLLVLWCFQIARPFLNPIVWGIVIAIAAWPLHLLIENAMGGRRGLAAGTLTLGALLLLIVPTVLLTTSMVGTASDLADELSLGSISVPPPPEGVASWPLVGERVFDLWSAANNNLGAFLSQYSPQLKAAGLYLVSTAATTGVGILMFIISIVIAGVLLANAEGGGKLARGIATRLVGERGNELIDLSSATIQGVTRGILGVALIQALLAGAGFLAVGVPAAGLWALIVLLLAVVQLPPTLIILPLIIYVFSTNSTLVSVIFAVWSIFAGSIDTFLKPILMGRGVDVPMLVIFIGAIGGFMLSGIIGLFTGAVVLALGYTLFSAWLGQEESG